MWEGMLLHQVIFILLFSVGFYDDQSGNADWEGEQNKAGVFSLVLISSLIFKGPILSPSISSLSVNSHSLTCFASLTFAYLRLLALLLRKCIFKAPCDVTK